MVIYFDSIIALQKLKFWYKFRHSSNRTVCNVSMFLSMGKEYNTLLVNYACSATDSAGKFRFKIERHYADICAARVGLEASI